MGMDVRGIKPRLKVDAGNFACTALAHAGEYFRANVWGWAPIRLICGWMNNYWGLGLDMAGWQYNDGKGLKTQNECDLLPRAIDDIEESGLAQHSTEGRKNPTRQRTIRLTCKNGKRGIAGDRVQRFVA